MSGENATHESAWNTDTLKEKIESDLNNLEKLMDRRFSDNDVALKAALLAVKEDSAKIALAMEKRFEGVNEFRKTLSDQTNTFLPRPEYYANHKALGEKIQALTDRMNRTSGVTQGAADSRKGLYATIAAIGVITTVVISLIVLIANGKL